MSAGRAVAMVVAAAGTHRDCLTVRAVATRVDTVTAHLSGIPSVGRASMHGDSIVLSLQRESQFVLPSQLTSATVSGTDQESVELSSPWVPYTTGSWPQAEQLMWYGEAQAHLPMSVPSGQIQAPALQLSHIANPR